MALCIIKIILAKFSQIQFLSCKALLFCDCESEGGTKGRRACAVPIPAAKLLRPSSSSFGSKRFLWSEWKEGLHGTYPCGKSSPPVVFFLRIDLLSEWNEGFGTYPCGKSSPPVVFFLRIEQNSVEPEGRQWGWFGNRGVKMKIVEDFSIFERKSYSEYRDRAAERRALHGGFGTGLGQKSFVDDDGISGTSQAAETDGVLNEAINASFGPGSYARKILQGMGWKHGESLGSSNKGILEPLCPVGNKGYAGLGWNHARRGEN